MTIEVRQMVIRSSVSPDASQPATSPADAASLVEALERMRAEIIAECREIVRGVMTANRER